MKKKALLISNVTNRFTNFIIPPIETLEKMDYEVHTCANYSNFEDDKNKYNIKMHHIDFYRNPFNIKNIKAYKQLLKLTKKEEFSAIHCNTPIGGVLGRICGNKSKVDKIIYTAHGFHFFNGNSKIKNFVFKNIEKILAHKTDAIITMNKEDYEAAKKFRLKKNGKVYFVHGVGINLEEYNDISVNIEEKRKELNILKDDVVLISMGDLIQRKNYSLALDIIAKCNNKKIKYLICGKGPELNNLKEQAKKLEIEDQVAFLGYRNDTKELLKISDVFIFTSKQEGLPRSLMEAMAAGLPCVVSKIRGNVDLIKNGQCGYVCDNIDKYVESLNILINNSEIKNNMIRTNLNVIKEYSVENVKKEIEEIYKDIGL